jgi:hypothetical protein
MNAQNAKEYLPFVQALAEGKTIQTKIGMSENWSDVGETYFEAYPINYRIKPEPRRWWIVKFNEHRHDIAFTLGVAEAIRREAIPYLPASYPIEIIEVEEVLK